MSLKTTAALGALAAVAGKNFYNTSTSSDKAFTEGYENEKKKYEEEKKAHDEGKKKAKEEPSETKGGGKLYGKRRKRRNFGVSKKQAAAGAANAALLSGLSYMFYAYPERARRKNYDIMINSKKSDEFPDKLSGYNPGGIRPFSERRLSLFNLVNYGKKRRRSVVKKAKKVRRRRSRK